MNEITTIPTIEEIKATCIEHHTAWMRGYVSRKKPEGIIEPYKGRFGEGYTVKTPSWQSTAYCHITYYITKETYKSEWQKACERCGMA
jgi:hypothetical protein